MHILLEHFEIVMPILRQIEKTLIGPLINVWSVSNENDTSGGVTTILTHIMRGKTSRLSWGISYEYGDDWVDMKLDYMLDIDTDQGTRLTIFVTCPIKEDMPHYTVAVESTLTEDDNAVLRTLAMNLPEAFKEPQSASGLLNMFLFLFSNFMMVENPLRDYEVEAARQAREKGLAALAEEISD